MTWGSPYYNSGQSSNHCTTCAYLDACRNACRTRQPVLCEDGGRRTSQRIAMKEAEAIRKAPRPPFVAQCCIAYVNTNQTFTAADLRERLGLCNTSATSWIRSHVKAGDVVQVDIIRNAGHTYSPLYRYIPASANEPLEVEP